MKHFHFKDEKERLKHELEQQKNYVESLEAEQDQHIMNVTHAKMSYVETAVVNKKIRSLSDTIKTEKKKQRELQARYDSLKIDNK